MKQSQTTNQNYQLELLGNFETEIRDFKSNLDLINELENTSKVDFIQNVDFIEFRVKKRMSGFDRWIVGINVHTEFETRFMRVGEISYSTGRRGVNFHFKYSRGFKNILNFAYYDKLVFDGNEVDEFDILEDYFNILIYGDRFDSLREFIYQLDRKIDSKVKEIESGRLLRYLNKKMNANMSINVCYSEFSSILNRLMICNWVNVKGKDYLELKSYLGRIFSKKEIFNLLKNKSSMEIWKMTWRLPSKLTTINELPF